MPGRITSHAQAVKMGHNGGKKGGPARAKALSASERTRIASKGGKASHKR